MYDCTSTYTYSVHSLRTYYSVVGIDIIGRVNTVGIEELEIELVSHQIAAGRRNLQA